MNDRRSDYEQATSGLLNFGASLHALITQLLQPVDVAVHSVDYRIKRYESAEKKLVDGVHKYSSYNDLTDMLGLRVITYFAEQVDQVADTLKPAFKIDIDNSPDKRALMDPDRFGYTSLHLVAELSEQRQALPENLSFVGMRFELQIRSILQHAWAEIEHDLGYKNPKRVPRIIRRRFSRLAGLLELADAEFDAIRKELDTYAEDVSEQLNEDASTASAPSVFEVDQTSIAEFIKSEPLINEIDHQLATLLRARVRNELSDNSNGQVSEWLTSVGVVTIYEVRMLLRALAQHIVWFAREWIDSEIYSDDEPSSDDWVNHGISLFYLTYVVLAQLPPQYIDDGWGVEFHDLRDEIIEKARSKWLQVVTEHGQPDIDVFSFLWPDHGHDGASLRELPPQK
ncbi:GTP pyrophosphokinase [Kribbella endophytica]